MGSIVLVRHAQASFGADDYDRLSPLGHRQADWLGAYFKAHDLRFDRVVRGDLRRHRETFEALERHGVGPVAEIDPRLNEFDYDVLQNDYIRATGTGPAATREEFLQHFPIVFEGWAAGELGTAGETFSAFEARVAAAIDAVTAQGHSALVVTSGGVIGMVLRRVLRLDPRTTAETLLNVHNASVHRLTFEEGALRLALFNASPHLDPADRVHARTYI